MGLHTATMGVNRTVTRKRIKASVVVLATCVLAVAFTVSTGRLKIVFQSQPDTLSGNIDTTAQGYAQGYVGVEDMRKSLLESPTAAATALVANGHTVARRVQEL